MKQKYFIVLMLGGLAVGQAFGPRRVDAEDKKELKAGKTGVHMHKDHARQLMYKGILFKAPNVKEKPYYVAAIKGGKVLWEINDDALPPERQSSALKDGGIEKIVIQTVKESDLDSGAEDFEQVKRYVGKPALYVYYSKDTVINKLPSWLIVDIATGRKIGFMAFN